MYHVGATTAKEMIPSLVLLAALYACWTPPARGAGSRMIVYSSRVYKLKGKSYQELTGIRLPGMHRSVLSSTPRHHEQPLYSSDARQIAFVSGSDMDAVGNELWLRQARTGQERLLYRAPEMSSIDLVGWAPRAAGLYLVISGKSNRVCRYELPARKLVPIAGGCRAALSRDGTLLAYETCTDDFRQERDAYLYDAAAGKSRPLGKGSASSWSPDGRKIAMADRATRQLRVLDAETAAVITTAALPEHPEHWNYATSTAWSPDGKSILVGSEAGSSTAHYEDYWLLTIADKTWKYLEGGNGARWSPAGDSVVYSTPRDLAPLEKRQVWVSHLVLMDIRTGAKRPLTSGLSYDFSPVWFTPKLARNQR